MATYRTYDSLNLPAIDAEVLEYWQEQEIFRKSIDNRQDAPSFVFYEGPPSANGKPGIHHVLSRSLKDIFCRFNTMKGYRVARKGGWDTHGLPIELQVEKELGITKEDIGKKISVDEYNQACRRTVMRYKDVWDDITQKMGYWVDLENPYVTFENEYIESVWYLLKRLYDKDLLYKGYTIQPYSPAAGTGLSSHELNMPGAYQDVSDTSAVAQFKVKRTEESAFLYEGIDTEREGDVYFIAWTTTPWTLPSNTALAVGGDIDYVRVKTYNPYTKLPVVLILAKDLLGKWFKPQQAELSYDDFDPELAKKPSQIPYVIAGEYKGAQFEWLQYEQLLPYQQPETGEAFRVLVGDFVSTSDGTGIVHLAPSFGADDMRVCKQYNIGALTLVDKQGKFVEGVGEFSGRYVKDYKDEPDYESVDVSISVKLKQENKAFNVQKYQHNYPHCWRTDKPILYYPLDSWFIRSTAAKARMIELNKTINWKPKSTGEGRFGKWLENLQDWNLSRSRYWGIPLPIWRTKDGSQEKCIGSIEELRQEIEKANAAFGESQNVPADLHRPYIDDVVLVSETGERMYRELDLIDVWFDSGSMPYAQWHYPFENAEKFAENYPADFIAEGVDQTRGWFFTLHAIATMAFDSVAYKNVVSNGLVLDKVGKKMSKRLGNGVDPFDTIAQYGADATRWYMISNAQPWDNLKFDLDGLDEVRRKFFGTLYNTYSFFALYANVDGFAYQEAEVPQADRPEIDRWILSLLNSLTQEVIADLADYEPTNATRKIQNFVDEHLSNWYVRQCRRRFWKGDYSQDKISAYQTLYTCLETLAKLIAPVAPFFADRLYQDLNAVTQREAHESVHLAALPDVRAEWIDKALEQRMDYAQNISSLILSLRKRDNLRVRQPLQKVLLPILDESFSAQVDAVKDLILQEVNVKEIEYVTDTSGILKKGIKPNFKTLGRKLGKHMKAVQAAINDFTQADIAKLEREKTYTLDVEGATYDLTLEDFIITSEDLEGWSVASNKGVTVALDITLTDALIAEGLARELVNRIQNLRKAQQFEVMDRITVALAPHEGIQAAVAQYGDYIRNEVLADTLTWNDALTAEPIELVEGIAVRIAVERV